MKRLCMMFALAAVLLLAGCGGTPKPVDGPATIAPTASVTAVPTGLPGTPLPAPSPAITPAPAPTSPPAYSFPMAATSLFGSTGAAVDFAEPLFLMPNASMFLYGTSDGRIVKGVWDTAGYSQKPVAEGVETGIGSSVYLDAAKSRLCCAGSKMFAADRTGPAVVIVDMASGARCNADDLCGWKKENSALSNQFQYCNGTVLTQILQYKDGNYILSDQWVAVNVDGKSYSSLDMSDFAEKYVPDWQTAPAYRLALTARNRLLAVCLAQKGDADTGTQEFGCFAIQIDTKGRVLGSTEITSKGKKPQDIALPQGRLYNASPDGKYLLYSGPQGAGVYLYDAEGGTEYEIAGTGGRACVFTQWGSGGTFYYGVASAQVNGQITIYKTSVQETEKE